MRAAAFAVILSLLTAPAVLAYDSFRAIARSLDSQPSLQRRSIPFAWVARAATRTIRPEGIHDFRIARFEGRGDSSAATRRAVEKALDDGYSRVLQVRERDGSSSVILARERTADRVQMIVMSQDVDETVLIELLLDRETFLNRIAADGTADPFAD